MTLGVQSKLSLALVGVAMMSLWQPAASHGRLWTPPGRATMWRRGYHTPRNYDDNQMFCGGLSREKRNGYKCGVCGDPWDLPTPRPNEAGGKFATGTIVGNYSQGQEVTIQVQITANHKGWFEFKLCPTNDYKKAATHACLDQHVLQLADGSGTKIYVEKYENSMVDIPVKLPEYLSCDFCVLQWRYHAGNNWDTDPDGKSCVGCGPQEEFYGCADIKISASNSQGGSGSGSSSRPRSRSTAPPARSSASPIVTRKPQPQETRRPSAKSTWSPNIPMILSCTALRSPWVFDTWCKHNCNMGNCPANLCSCQKVPDPRFYSGLPPGCYAMTPFVDLPGMDKWCADNCAVGVCQKSRCLCL